MSVNSVNPGFYHGYLPSDAPPKSGKFYQQHTIKDLKSIELEPSNLILRPVISNPELKEVDWDARLKNSYTRYNTLAAASGRGWWTPSIRFNSWFDRFRYRLHKLLLRYGVII